MGGSVAAAACRCSLWDSSSPPTASSAERPSAWSERVSRRSSWWWCLADCRRPDGCDGSGRGPARCWVRPPLHGVLAAGRESLPSPPSGVPSAPGQTTPGAHRKVLAPEECSWVRSTIVLDLCIPGRFNCLLKVLKPEEPQDDAQKVLNQKMCF